VANMLIVFGILNSTMISQIFRLVEKHHPSAHRRNGETLYLGGLIKESQLPRDNPSISGSLNRSDLLTHTTDQELSSWKEPHDPRREVHHSSFESRLLTLNWWTTMWCYQKVGRSFQKPGTNGVVHILIVFPRYYRG
jgi:hypothetical protein